MQIRSSCDADDIVSKKNNTGSTMLKGMVVKMDTTQDCIVLPAATTDGILGVVRNDIAPGAMGDVQIEGLAIVLAGGAISVGGEVMANTSGKGVAFSAGAGTNANLLGKANSAASVDGDYIEVELSGPGTIKQG